MSDPYIRKEIKMSCRKIKNASIIAVVLTAICTILNIQSSIAQNNGIILTIQSRLADATAGNASANLFCRSNYPPMSGEERECSLSFRIPHPADQFNSISFIEVWGGPFDGRRTSLTIPGDSDSGRVRLVALQENGRRVEIISVEFRNGLIVNSPREDVFNLAEVVSSFPHIRIEYVLNGTFISSEMKVNLQNKPCIREIYRESRSRVRSNLPQRHVLICNYYNHLRQIRISDREEAIRLLSSENDWAQHELRELNRQLNNNHGLLR